MGLLTRLWSFLLGDGPLLLNGPEYHHFREIIIPTTRGTTEIDHLIVSRFGVFVVELKDRSGWIFGNAYNPVWAAVHFGEKFRFQNPLHQNYGHIKGLQEFLGVDNESCMASSSFADRSSSRLQSRRASSVTDTTIGSPPGRTSSWTMLPLRP